VKDKYDFKNIMDTWTIQIGFPHDNVTRTGNMLEAKQEHFLIDPASGVDDDKYLDDFGYLWYIQLTHTHKSEMEYDTPLHDWMNGTDGATLTFSLGGTPDASDWYLINIKQ
ncbi:hypothetical protein, partial [Salmonella sp. s54395]|uniref:hypothetical protein n=1 Tax=Salmonella sp. s54395 TaxID=3159664 RepID=UPI003980B160